MGVFVTNVSRASGGRGADRVTLYATAVLVMQVLVLAIWSVRYYVLHEQSAPMLGWDFVVFWSAARVALEHGAASVFSPQLMYAVEVGLTPFGGGAKWPYPPTFLLPLIPLGLLPFSVALASFSAVGIALYACVLTRAARGLARPNFLIAAAFPGIPVALAAGQNSLLTVAAAGSALWLLEANSVLAAVCIATLAIKPQFAVLFPLVLICSRQWRTLVASAACCVAFVGLSAAVLGLDAWTAFISYLPKFNQVTVVHGTHLWNGMPTLFAASRLAGLSVGAAYAVHVLVVVPAVVATAYLWLRPARFELRATALTVTTLLVQPYLMFYDLAWLALPILFLMRDAKVSELSRLEWVMLGAAWLTPAQGFLAVVFGAPCQIAPAVLTALLAMTMRRHFATQKVRTSSSIHCAF
ncbi:DUF2029 domain-containing protein [Trinickia violacea]|uniref:DUF2029 domain-containing protein n=2 Tax=Trinickia violacea TaxID=2571746 RepID=A0A4P8J279_9BURK|nr:DUF2029 domain-containing protein [Trinickia violacea]